MSIFKKNIFDISGSLKTLKTGNSPKPTSIDTALSYLLSTQRPDGGWGPSENEESNVYATAVVSIILKQFSQTPQLAVSINKAADYLIAKQNADGGFGSGSSVIHETALAYIALINNTKDVAVLNNARNYLISMQLTNDSWNNDPNSTVSALRALCSENSKQIEGPKPDRYWHDCGMDRYFDKEIEAPEPEKGSIIGQVINSSTKAPLKDVSICLESDPEKKAISDISGKFELSDILSGNQNIMLTLMEYTSDVVSVEVNSSTAINLGVLTLLSNLAADDKKGIVTDATEDHDEAVVTDEPKEYGIATKVGTRKKDLRKKVSIAMLRRGAYDAVKPEIIPTNEPALSGPQITTPSFTSTGIITGSVFDNVTKQAIRNALVNVSGKPPVSTDEEGVFTVQDVFVPDTCQVTISKEGYADQFYQGDLATNETMDMLVYLVPTCVDSDEASEAETISNPQMTPPMATQQPTTTNATLNADQLNALLAGTADVFRLGPEIMIKLDETLTPLAVVPDGDKQIKVDIRLEGIRVVTDPVVLFAATNAAGDKIMVAFDKVMVDPSDNYMKFGVKIDDVPVSVIAAVLNRSDNTKIDLALALPMTGGQNILLNYTAGDVKSSDDQELASFSDQVVSNKVLPPVYGQDGFGYSGLVAQNPLQDDIFMTGYNQWPSGFYKNVLAFISGVFDGQNVWMIPANADSVIKIDKDTGVMTGYNKWPAGFRKGNLAFEGGVFDGQNVWMIPANADSVIKIDKDTGVMTEYDNWPSEFKKGGHAFAGGVFDGQNIWMIPYYADRVVTIDKDMGAMSWHHQRPSEFNNVEYAFTGGVFDGESIWMIPLNADSIVKINKNTGIEAKYNQWPSGFSKGVNAFTGGIFDGESIWMVPSSADKVIRLSSFSPISVSANVTANDSFYFYISQDEFTEGILVGQGSSWTSVYSLNAALVPGVTNYLHIKSIDASGPIAAFIGDFLLNDQNFHFKNNTQHLLTGEDCWTVYTDAFGGTKGTITTICKNGMGKWSTRFGIDLSAQWIWTNGGRDHIARYFSTPIYYSTVSANPVTNVRVIDTILDTNIVIDSNSFTKEPYQLSSEREKTTVEWRFEEISMGQIENLSFNITLKDPVSGEDRPVSDKLELFYEDGEKKPVRTELGPCHVHVFNIAFTSSITTDKGAYKPQEDVVMEGTIKSLSEIEQSIDVKIVIENSQGALVEEVTALSDLTLQEGEEKNLKDLIFKTSTHYSGDYRAHLIFYENLKQVGEASADFTIEAVLPVSLDLPPINKTDETASMTEKTSQKVTAKATDIAKEIVTNEIDLDSKTIEAPNFTEKIEEPESGSDTTEEVAVELIGTISAQPNPVYQGLAVSISYSVTNDVNQDMKDLTVNLIIINPDTEEVKKTFEAPAKARKGASIAGIFILSTAIFEPRVYTAVLQVAQTKKEVPKAIASTNFEVRLINVMVT